MADPVQTIDQDAAIPEGLEPHETNTMEADIRAAMDQASKPAEEAPAEDPAEKPEEGAAEPIDFNKAKAETTKLEPEGDAPAKEAEEIELGDLEPPPEWSAEHQDVFRGVTKEVQQWLLDTREADLAPLRQQVEAVAPLQRLQAEWEPYTKNVGVPFDKAIDSVMRTEMILRTGTPEQKRATIAQLAQTYGVELGESPGAVSEELFNDPVYGAVNQRLSQVMSGLETLKSQMDTNLGSLRASQEAQAQAALDAFANKRDDKGQLLHPYFEEVKGLMNTLAAEEKAAGRQTTIEDVYHQACRASPTVWPKIQSAERSAGLRERQKAAADKVRAASSVSSSPSGARMKAPDGPANESAEETVRRLMAQAMGAE